MRRLITWTLLTLDGRAAGASSGTPDQHEHDWSEELRWLSLEQSRSTDTLLFGRVTYERMAAYWPTANGAAADFLNTTPKLVFSRTLKHADWSNTRLVTGDPETEVASLKRQPGKDLLILGSARLSALLVHHGLVDEWRIGVSPLVLGGHPSPEPDPCRMRMKLLETRRLESGCLIVRYQRPGKSRPTPAFEVSRPVSLRRQDRLSNGTATAVDGPFAETKEWLLTPRSPGRHR